MQISVIIPVKERPEMLSRAIRSVLNQSFPIGELIVVNDGSANLLTEARGIIEDAGQIWVDQESTGVSAARNHGIKLSSGEWIAFLDSDDCWKERKIESQVEFHNKNPEIRISQCEEEWHRRGTRVNQKNIHKMPSGDAFPQSLKLCCISPSSVLLHRELFYDYGSFDESLPVCEDYDLWLRITPFEHVGLIQEKLVVKYGGHSDQLSRSEPAIDRFRLYALFKILSNKTITPEQRGLAVEEAKRKLTVLKKGAEKHAPQNLPLYQELERNLSSSSFEHAERVFRQLFA